MVLNFHRAIKKYERFNIMVLWVEMSRLADLWAFRARNLNFLSLFPSNMK